MIGRDRFFSSQHADNLEWIVRVDNRQFINVQHRQLIQRRIQVVVWRYGHHVSRHHIPGIGDPPDRVVVQVAADIVRGENAQQLLLIVHDWMVALIRFGQHMHDLIE